MTVNGLLITGLCLAAASCTGGTSGTSTPGRHPTSISSAANGPSCGPLEHDPRLVSSASTTVGAVRRTNIGGPAPGEVPGAHAFPGIANKQPAAWCWVEAATASPPDAVDYILYAVTAGQAPFRYFAEGLDGRPGAPPQGPPSVP